MRDDPVFHVCLTCKRPDEPAAGQQLAAALTAAGLTVAAVQCHSACERAVTVSVSSPGKWRYLFGGLDHSHTADLVTYAESYRQSANGAVLRSRRPAGLADAVIARLPSF